MNSISLTEVSNRRCKSTLNKVEASTSVLKISMLDSNFSQFNNSISNFSFQLHASTLNESRWMTAASLMVEMVLTSVRSRSNSDLYKASKLAGLTEVNC